MIFFSIENGPYIDGGEMMAVANDLHRALLGEAIEATGDGDRLGDRQSLFARHFHRSGMPDLADDENAIQLWNQYDIVGTQLDIGIKRIPSRNRQGISSLRTRRIGAQHNRSRDISIFREST